MRRFTLLLVALALLAPGLAPAQELPSGGEIIDSNDIVAQPFLESVRREQDSARIAEAATAAALAGVDNGMPWWLTAMLDGLVAVFTIVILLVLFAWLFVRWLRREDEKEWQRALLEATAQTAPTPVAIPDALSGAVIEDVERRNSRLISVTVRPRGGGPVQLLPIAQEIAEPTGPGF